MAHYAFGSNAPYGLFQPVLMGRPRQVIAKPEPAADLREAAEWSAADFGYGEPSRVPDVFRVLDGAAELGWLGLGARIGRR
jgi:hypothetical protein